MFADDFLLEIEFERGTEGDFTRNFRERNGAYRLGRIEDDPEMDHFDDLVDLASSLRR